MGNSAHSRLSKEGSSECSPRSFRHKSLSRRESSSEQNKRLKDVSGGILAENGPEAKVISIKREVVMPKRLSERQKELLTETWKELEENIARVGVIMYIGLFETHPDVQEAFMPFKGIELKELIHSKQLRSHALRVMGFVQKAVARLHEPEKLDVLLRDLGKKHYNYSAKPEYVDLIGPQFIQAIKPSLEDKWTDETHEAWTALFEYMSFVMKAEMDLEERKAVANSNPGAPVHNPSNRSTTSSKTSSSNHNNPKNHGSRRASSDAAAIGGVVAGVIGNSRRGTLH